MNPNGSNEILFPGRVWQEREGKIFGVYFLFISGFFFNYHHRTDFKPSIGSQLVWEVLLYSLPSWNCL